MKSLIKKLESIKGTHNDEKLFRFVKQEGILLKVGNSSIHEFYKIDNRVYMIDTRGTQGFGVTFDEYQTRQIRKAELDRIQAELMASI